MVRTWIQSLRARARLDPLTSLGSNQRCPSTPSSARSPPRSSARPPCTSTSSAISASGPSRRPRAAARRQGAPGDARLPALERALGARQPRARRPGRDDRRARAPSRPRAAARSSTSRSEGMGRRIDELPRISRESGVTICVGCGWYVEELHPPEIERPRRRRARRACCSPSCATASSDTGIRPRSSARSARTTRRPRRVARTSARRAARARSPAPPSTCTCRSAARTASTSLEALVDGGHAGRPLHPQPHGRAPRPRLPPRRSREAGAILEYDTFGSDFLYGTPRAAQPRPTSSASRWPRGCCPRATRDQLVLACDTWTKANLRRNGGFGYEHLFRRIVPALQDLAGADDATMQTIMVDTPRRLLDR